MILTEGIIFWHLFGFSPPALYVPVRLYCDLKHVIRGCIHPCFQTVKAYPIFSFLLPPFLSLFSKSRNCDGHKMKQRRSNDSPEGLRDHSPVTTNRNQKKLFLRNSTVFLVILSLFLQTLLCNQNSPILFLSFFKCSTFNLPFHSDS